MENSFVLLLNHTLEEWIDIVRRHIDETKRCIERIKNGEAKKRFVYYWILENQILVGNNSINKYISSEERKKAKELVERFEVIMKKYGCFAPESKKIYEDKNFLLIYKEKLGLEEKILEVLKTVSHPWHKKSIALTKESHFYQENPKAE